MTSKSELYRIKTLTGLNPREEREQSPHASASGWATPPLHSSSAPSGDVTTEEDEAWETLALRQRGFIIPSPSMLMGGAILALSITTFLFWNLYRNTANDFANYKATVETINEQIRADTERKLAELAELQWRTEQNWRTALDALKSRPIRVRNDGCQGSLPAVPGSAPDPHGPPIELRLDPDGSITVERCEEIANRAVADAAHVVFLQQWILDQREATK